MTTTTTPAIRPTTASASAPAASERPVVVRTSRAQRVAGGALVLAAVGVAVGVSLVDRSAGTAAEVAAPTVAAPPFAAAAAYAVGDTAHGGPGSRADVLRDAPSTSAPSAAVTGETAHGGPGSRTDDAQRDGGAAQRL
jgi:hypothetical protein